MTSPAPTGSQDAEFLLHAAGPMVDGVQRCIGCRELLADETGLDLEPGSTRYGRGSRVLVLNGAEYRVTGPLGQNSKLPPSTRLCTTPAPSTTKDTR